MSVPTGAGPPGAADRQAAFCATLVDEWARAGVTHAVVCPGSRSAPLALALAADGRLAVDVHHDERSAGFVALGTGLASGRPTVVVTTSGTAAAELHAAVVEADLGRVPLLVCTADRPPELRDVGAPQTIDQDRLFGGAPRWFADPGVPDEATRSAWRSLAARAVAEAAGGRRGPGPVHLNLPFREPLLGEAGAAGGPPPGRPAGRPWHRVDAAALLPDPSLVARLAGGEAFAPGAHGVVVAGAGCGEPDAVLGLAAALGWPVLADARSGLRGAPEAVVATADSLVRAPAFAAAHRPAFVLRLGGPWASKPVGGFLAGIEDLVVDPWDRWVDPGRDATGLVRCDPTALCRGLADALAARPGPGPADGWAASWRRAEVRAREVLAGALAEGAVTSEPLLAHALGAAVPAGTPLVVSSSMPVRDVESFALPRPGFPTVLANRGANGIDGVVSTALGVARAAGSAVALVGDLAFLHDLTALVGPPGGRPPVTVVVADNGGGGIFSFLPPAERLDPQDFERLFGTPPGTDVAAAARGLGWPTVDVAADAGRRGLDDRLSEALGSGRAGVVRVALPDRTANVAAHAGLHAAVAGAVDAG